MTKEEAKSKIEEEAWEFTHYNGTDEDLKRFRKCVDEFGSTCYREGYNKGFLEAEEKYDD
jgi:hypothetical protein